MTSHQSDWATLPNPAVRQVLVALTTTTGGCNADVLQTRLVCKAWQQEVDYFVTDIGVRRRSLLFGSQFALERYGGYMYADIAHCASARVVGNLNWLLISYFCSTASIPHESH